MVQLRVRGHDALATPRPHHQNSQHGRLQEVHRSLSAKRLSQCLEWRRERARNAVRAANLNRRPAPRPSSATRGPRPLFSSVLPTSLALRRERSLCTRTVEGPGHDESDPPHDQGLPCDFGVSSSRSASRLGSRDHGGIESNASPACSSVLFRPLAKRPARRMRAFANFATARRRLLPIRALSLTSTRALSNVPHSSCPDPLCSTAHHPFLHPPPHLPSPTVAAHLDGAPTSQPETKVLVEVEERHDNFPPPMPRVLRSKAEDDASGEEATS